MQKERIFEYIFFFLLLAGFGFLGYRVLAPFIPSIVLSAIIVTISYPLYEKIKNKIFKNNAFFASVITTFVVALLVIIPSFIIITTFAQELIHFSKSLNTGREVFIEEKFTDLEEALKGYLPGYQLDLKKQIIQGTEGMIKGVSSIFAGTISVAFMIFVSLIGSFYFFKDGKKLLEILIKISPLPEEKNKKILAKVASAIRSIAMGALLSSIISGAVASIGFTVAGIDKAVTLGIAAGLISIIPGVGTFMIILPAIIYLFIIGKIFTGIGLLIWATVAAIIVDNFITPHLMGKGSTLHPFFIFVSILGGVTFFGPIGFMIGPMIITTFVVLLDIYREYILESVKIESKS